MRLIPSTQPASNLQFGRTWAFLPSLRRAAADVEPQQVDTIDIGISPDPNIDEFYLQLAKPFQDLAGWMKEGLTKEMYRTRPAEFYPDTMSPQLRANFALAGHCEDQKGTAVFAHAKRKQELKDLLTECQSAINEIFTAGNDALANRGDEAHRELDQIVIQDRMETRLNVLQEGSKRLIGRQKTLFERLF